MNGSFLIPSEFQLNKKVIRVCVDTPYCEDPEENCYGCSICGEADFTSKEIILSETLNKKKLSKRQREVTFYHELVHMILDSMGRHRQKYDELFVELFARRLYEYERTKK